MRKILILSLFSISFFGMANNSVEIEAKENSNKTCTVTITFLDSDGHTTTGTGTAENCSDAKAIAMQNLTTD